MGNRGSRGRITLNRGKCPVCGQSMSGGIQHDTGLLRIRKHNRPGVSGTTTTGPCPGWGQQVKPYVVSDRPDVDTPQEGTS